MKKFFALLISVLVLAMLSTVLISNNKSCPDNDVGIQLQPNVIEISSDQLSVMYAINDPPWIMCSINNNDNEIFSSFQMPITDQFIGAITRLDIGEINCSLINNNEIFNYAELMINDRQRGAITRLDIGEINSSLIHI